MIPICSNQSNNQMEYEHLKINNTFSYLKKLKLVLSSVHLNFSFFPDKFQNNDVKKSKNMRIYHFD